MYTVGIWKPASITSFMLQKRPKFVQKHDKMQKFAAGNRILAPKHPPSMMPSADLQLIFPLVVLHPVNMFDHISECIKPNCQSVSIFAKKEGVQFCGEITRNIWSSM